MHIFLSFQSVILRPHIINTHQLLFDPNIVIGPDWVFFARYAEFGSFGHLNVPTCLYRIHAINITTQINPQKRTLEFAQCRRKAIKLNRFRNCSVETRCTVFYDILINLQNGYPEQQIEITQENEFRDLPPEHKAKLSRVLASKAIIHGCDPKYINRWFTQSREFNPLDWRGVFLFIIYQINPMLCKTILRIRTLEQPDQVKRAPFADVKKRNYERESFIIGHHP